MLEHVNYRDVIKSEFAKRRMRNGHYSIRSFARDLNIAYSRVNEVMNGKRGLSRKNAHKIARKLGLNEEEKKIFVLNVESQHSRSKVFRQAATKKLDSILLEQDRNQLQLDVFESISNWYHYAILELTYLTDFDPYPEHIANRLGITKIEAELAIERMLRVGLLEAKDNTLKASDDFTMSTSGVPSMSIKKNHEQILDKAKDSIYLQSIEQRDLSSVTMAINKNQISKAKELIKKFRRELNALMSVSSEKDAVYCLAIQFFQLDKTADQNLQTKPGNSYEH